jgi:hypothetical protein
MLLAASPFGLVSAAAIDVQPALQAGGDRLMALQNDDGGWDWPLDNGDPATGSALNTVGPIAKGLAEAYSVTGDAAQLAALGDAGSLLLSKTSFSTSDGYLAAALDEVFGGNTYVSYIKTNFYDALAAGTYDRDGTTYTTEEYVNFVRNYRSGQSANLAAWDVGMGLVSAASCGVTGTELQYWIDGAKAEINELDDYDDESNVMYYFSEGLAGALYGLAFVGEDIAPVEGYYAGAANIGELFDALAALQNPNGGIIWHPDYTLEDDQNEGTQKTAYSILAFNEYDRNAYLDNIIAAADYLMSIQLPTGGWDNYPAVGSYEASGENNEITAEALWGIAVAYDLPLTEAWVCETGDCGHPGAEFASIQDALDMVVEGGVVNVLPGVYAESPNITKAVTVQGTVGGDFSLPVPLSDSQENGKWYVDRYAPDAFESYNFNGEPVLRQAVGADGVQGQTFYNYQGRKLDTNLMGGRQSMSIDLWLDPAWATSFANAGIWATGTDGSSVSAYPIIAWRSSEDGSVDPAGFYGFDYIKGGYFLLKEAEADDYGQWHTLAFDLNVGTGMEYYVDGELVKTFDDPDTSTLINIILNVYNYGESYDVYWDNFKTLSDAPAAYEAAIIGQTTITANNVTLQNLMFSNPGGNYGVLIPSPSTGPTYHDFVIAYNKFQEIGGPATTANIKGLYFPQGADNLQIIGNIFNNIRSGATKSVTAVNNGDSNSTDPSEGVVILHNDFVNISSEGKGAYGILMNNIAGAPGVIIAHNTFSDFYGGGWTHAIGLEGPSFNAVVVKNVFDNLVSAGPDNSAIFFEDNNVGETVTVEKNQFNQDSFLGVAVHPDDIAAYNYFVHASPNWWSSNDGPSATQTYGEVGFTPWCALPDCSILNPHVIPAGTPGADVQAILDMAPEGTTIIFEGSPGSYTGGFVINNPGLTILLQNGTVIRNDSPCFVINADYTTIKAESPLGAVCEPTDGSNAFEVNGDRMNIVIEGLEISGAEGANGIDFDGVVTDLVISDTYIHGLPGAGLFFAAQPAGTIQIQGNLFMDNGGNGIEAGALSIPAEFNAWGAYDGPAAGDGISAGVDADPWTHVDVSMVSAGTDYPNSVYLGQSITFDVTADMVNAMGADFVLEFPAELDYLDATPGGLFDTEDINRSGNTIHFVAYQIANGALTGEDLVLFSVEFEGAAAGKLLTLNLDETSDVFSMAPGYGPSTNIYAADLLDITDAEVNAYPTMDIVPAGAYIAGLPIEFSVDIDNADGDDFDSVGLKFYMPGDAIFEYWDGTAWVAVSSDPFVLGALAADAAPSLPFRVLFVSPGENVVAVELYDLTPDPDLLLAEAEETFNTLGGFEVGGTISMQGRTVRSGVPMKLASINVPYYADNQIFSSNEISDNVLFEGVNGGLYEITTSQPRYLNVSAELGRLLDVIGDMNLPALELKGGNADWSDNVIDISDAGIVGGLYGNGGLEDDGDVNFDDRVNIQDLALVGGNYDLTSETAYAGWPGFTEVSGTFAMNETTGEFTADVSGAYSLHIEGQGAPAGPNLTSFTGTVSGDIDGTIEGMINAQGMDILYAVITPNSGDPVRLYGTLLGEFQGWLVSGVERAPVTSVEITGPTTVAVGDTIDLDVLLNGAAADRPVLWSVYVDNSDLVDVDLLTGEVTGEQTGTATVIVTVLDDSNVSHKTINIDVTP